MLKHAHLVLFAFLTISYTTACNGRYSLAPKGTSRTSTVSISDLARRSSAYSSQLQKFRFTSGFTKYSVGEGRELTLFATLSGEFELDGEILINGKLPVKSSVIDSRKLFGTVGSGVQIVAKFTTDSVPNQVRLQYRCLNAVRIVTVSPIGDDPDAGYLYVDKEVVFGLVPSSQSKILEGMSPKSYPKTSLVCVDRWGPETRYYFLESMENNPGPETH